MSIISINELEIQIQSELKKIYFSILSIKIMKPEFSNLKFDEKLNFILKLINDQRTKFDGFIQLFSFPDCIGIEHIKYALYHSLKNIYKKNMISNLPENEILLYLSIQRQISKAYGTMGIKKEDFVDNYFTKGLLLISQNRNSIEDKVNELKEIYEIKPIIWENIESTASIIEKANKYGISLDQTKFQDPRSLYTQCVARLNEKMIKLTIDNLS